MNNEEGYATITATGIIASLTALLGIIAWHVTGVIDSHRAQVAADLSAVAGATAMYYSSSACQQARHTAQLNAAQLESCREIEADVEVTVSVGRRHAIARAGPL